MTNLYRVTLTLSKEEEAAIRKLKKTNEFAMRPLSWVVRYLIDKGMVHIGLKSEDDA